MDFDNPHLKELLSNFHSFHVEAFNIFALGDDQLAHLICACPNRHIALALCTLLEHAEKAHALRVLDINIVRTCHLSPVLLANGELALAITSINGPVYVNGKELHEHGPKLQPGTSDDKSFVAQFTNSVGE